MQHQQITAAETIEQRLQSLADTVRSFPDLDGLDTVLLDQAADMIERVLIGYECRHDPIDALTLTAIQARIGGVA